MRSNFVNHDIPSLLSTVIVALLGSIYRPALRSMLITRFMATMADSDFQIRSILIRPPLNTVAISELKKQGKCPSEVKHRQVKYLNNVIECDHGKLKRIIHLMLGFKSLKTAYAAIKGIEVMRALGKG